ncbi:MAG: hypothetical protein U0441_14225 [Polyangiaceae bacterium]
MTYSVDLAVVFPGSPEAGGAASERLRGVRVALAPDARLHFGVLLPRGFTVRVPGPIEGAPGQLLSAVDSPAADAEVSVIADEVPREVNPADWVSDRLASAGHAVIAARRKDGPSGAAGDLLTRVVTASGPHLARTNTVKDGARIFAVTCRAREDRFADLAADYLAVLASFTLLAPERAPLAEPLASFTAIHPAVVGFRHPRSWHNENERADLDAQDVRLDALHEGRCAGRIYVQARLPGRGQKSRLVTDFVERMRAEGMVLAASLDLEDGPAPEGFDRASFAAVPSSREGAPAELRVATFENEAALILVAVRGPSRASSSYWWAVNKRAFDLVVESLHAV